MKKEEGEGRNENRGKKEGNEKEGTWLKGEKGEGRNESRRKKEGDEWVGRNKSKGKRKK